MTGQKFASVVASKVGSRGSCTWHNSNLESSNSPRRCTRSSDGRAERVRGYRVNEGFSSRILLVTHCFHAKPRSAKHEETRQKRGSYVPGVPTDFVGIDSIPGCSKFWVGRLIIPGTFEAWRFIVGRPLHRWMGKGWQADREISTPSYKIHGWTQQLWLRSNLATPDRKTNAVSDTLLGPGFCYL